MPRRGYRLRLRLGLGLSDGRRRQRWQHEQGRVDRVPRRGQSKSLLQPIAMGTLLEPARLQRVLQSLLEGGLVLRLRLLFLRLYPQRWRWNIVVDVDAEAALLML